MSVARVRSVVARARMALLTCERPQGPGDAAVQMTRTIAAPVVKEAAASLGSDWATLNEPVHRYALSERGARTRDHGLTQTEHGPWPRALRADRVLRALAALGLDVAAATYAAPDAANASTVRAPGCTTGCTTGRPR